MDENEQDVSLEENIDRVFDKQIAENSVLEGQRKFAARRAQLAAEAEAQTQYAVGLQRGLLGGDASWREQALREKAVELAIRMNAINPENMIATAERIYAFLRGSEAEATS